MMPPPDLPTNLPLCVDLDGTLIRTNMLLETLAQAAGRQPWVVLLAPFWVLRGRANLKRRLAERVQFDPGSLPYNNELLVFLKEAHAAGRKLVLATASDQLVADRIGRYVGLFDEIIGTCVGMNLKGLAKLDALRTRFPDGFDYAGDARADLPIWKFARRSIVVGGGSDLVRAVRADSNVECVFALPRIPLWKRLISALRVHQWSKNLLVFVPVVTSHRLNQPDDMRASVLAFVAFCTCASSVYVVNDLVDLDSDRKHQSKRTRTFASGDLGLQWAFWLIPFLLTLALALTALLPLGLRAVMLLYLLVASVYSLYLKRIILLDVFSLSSLYTIRIVAGNAATGIRISLWLLSFSTFLFLSLAFNKRTSELHNLRDLGGIVAHGRGYTANDMEQINIFGVASGFVAALVFSLYVSSDAVLPLYRHPRLLLLISPALLYWICRMWIISVRGDMHEDPIVFAIKDPVTYYVAVLAAAIMLISTPEWNVSAFFGFR